MRITLKDQRVKQGSVIRARVSVPAESRPILESLRGVTLSDTIYINHISAPIRSNQMFEADAKIIFVKVPESNTLNHKDGTFDLGVTWNEAEIVPTEAGEGFIFGDFNIPARIKFWPLVVLSLGLLVLAFLCRKLYLKRRDKLAVRRMRETLKNEIIGGRDYDDVVNIWKRKQEYQLQFPHITEALKKLELILFKYQFKPIQTEAERTEVLKAYEEFCSTVEGGFDGV